MASQNAMTPRAVTAPRKRMRCLVPPDLVRERTLRGMTGSTQGMRFMRKPPAKATRRSRTSPSADWVLMLKVRPKTLKAALEPLLVVGAEELVAGCVGGGGVGGGGATLGIPSKAAELNAAKRSA